MQIKRPSLAEKLLRISLALSLSLHVFLPLPLVTLTPSIQNYLEFLSHAVSGLCDFA